MNHQRTLSLLGAIAVASSVSHAALIAHYTFESGTFTGTGTSLLVDDVTGNNHNLDSNGTNSVVTDLDHGSVLSVTTSGMKVVGTGISTTAGASQTFAFWLKTTDSDGYVLDQQTSRAIVTVGGSTGGDYGYYNGTWRDTATPVPVDGVWHHYAFVLDNPNDTMTVYLDGAPIAGITNYAITGGILDLNGAATQVLFGRYSWDNQGVKVGLWDDVRIYDEALDSTAIASLAAVPETSAALLGSLGALVLLRRRRS